MDPYYLDFALVGLAITIASLLRIFVRSQAVVIGAVALFVVLQIAAVAALRRHQRGQPADRTIGGAPQDRAHGAHP